jgi:hypothetical protein
LVDQTLQAQNRGPDEGEIFGNGLSAGDLFQTLGDQALAATVMLIIERTQRLGFGFF